MKSNKIKNMLVVASVVIGTTLVGSTSAFAATLPSSSSVSVNSSSKQSLGKTTTKTESKTINGNKGEKTLTDNASTISKTASISTTSKTISSAAKTSKSTTASKTTKTSKALTTLNDATLCSTTQYGEVSDLGSGYTSLNLRQGPGTSYNIIGELSSGTKVQIISQSNSDWYKIEYNGTTGYVYAPCITIVSGSSSNSSSSSSQTGTVTNLSGNIQLNFRSGPSTNYSVIGGLSEGTTFTILSENNGWYKINYDGTVGYVYGYYVSVGSGSSNTSSSSSKTGTVSNLNNGVELNFRSGPNTDYSIIGELSEGTTVTILSESNGWYKINYNGTVGYVYSDYISTGNSSSNSSSTTNNSSASSSSSSGSSITYTVQAGNTLSSIASQYGVTVSQLEQWNNLSNPNYIYVGETLTIYTNGSSSSSSNSSSSSTTSSSSSNSSSSGSNYTGSISYTAPSNLVNFTASYEGFSATPYYSGGWTVGFGQNYGNTYPGDVTYQEALDTLQNSLTTYMDQVENLTQGYNLNQNQINALTDFAYNLGIGSLEDSQLLQDIESGNTNASTIMSDFQSWSYIGGSFSSGLYARRTAEAQMFLYGQYNDN